MREFVLNLLFKFLLHFIFVSSVDLCECVHLSIWKQMDSQFWPVCFSSTTAIATTTILIMLVIAWILFCPKQANFDAGGKAIFITGCDSGIGFQLARHLHDAGFIIFAGCLDPLGQGARLLAQPQRDFLQLPCRLIILDLDVTNEIKVEKCVQFIAQYCNDNECGLWSLINNAGVCIGGDLDWQTMTQCQRQIDVNLMGSIRMIKSCLSLLKKTKGRIVNISSVNGRLSYPSFSIYGCTKFAIEGLSSALRMELASYGVHVVVVAPGDHARLTNIMKMQKEHAQQQWQSFSPEKRKEISDTFWLMQNYLYEHAGLTSPDSFNASPLLGHIMDALTSIRPKNRYQSTSLPFSLFFAICLNLPSTWLDFVIEHIRKNILKRMKHSSEIANE